MANQKKVETVQQLKETLEKSKLTILTDYRGLNTTDLSQMRRELRPLNAEYQITKNTLLEKALKDSDKSNLVPKEALEGPKATLFAFSDEVSPVKVILKLIKNLKLPVIKSGILQNQNITAEQVQELGRLPSKEILIGKVVGGISTPLCQIMGVLSGNIRNLVNVLNNIKEVKHD